MDGDWQEKVEQLVVHYIELDGEYIVAGGVTAHGNIPEGAFEVDRATLFAVYDAMKKGNLSKLEWRVVIG